MQPETLILSLIEELCISISLWCAPVPSFTKNAVALPSKLVFKAKLDHRNRIKSHKCRLVVQGNHQVKGRDYNNTFAPTVKGATVKVALSLATTHDLEVDQADFITAFLNGPITETIYVRPPPGLLEMMGEPLTNDAGEEPVWVLLKALYGLKQAPMVWNHELDSYLLVLGFKPTKSDKCIYVKWSNSGRPIILTLYVDDTLILYHQSDKLQWCNDKAKLNSKFPLEDLGPVDWILNMKVVRDRSARTMTLSQSAYIISKLEEYQLSNCRPSATPHTDPDSLVVPPESDPLYKEVQFLDGAGKQLYMSMVGSLMYAAVTTRVDIAFMTTVLSRYNTAPARKHLNAVNKVYKYLAGTVHLALQFNPNGVHSTGPVTGKGFTSYCDSSWGDCTVTRRSTSGLLVLHNETPVYWRSVRQPIVASSVTEAEYIVMSDLVRELQWLCNLLTELFGTTGTPVSIPIYTDSESAIKIAARDGSAGKTKHIAIKYHVILEAVDSGTIAVQWVPTNEQLADILTKPVKPTSLFEALRNRLLCDTESITGASGGPRDVGEQ